MTYREEDIENEFRDLFLKFFEFLEKDDFSLRMHKEIYTIVRILFRNNNLIFYFFDTKLDKEQMWLSTLWYIKREKE